MWWWLSLALAEPVQIGGKTAGHSLLLLGEGSNGLLVSPCNDAGEAPDAAPDGIWSCPPLEAPAERIAVLKDGRLSVGVCKDPKVLLLSERGLSCGGSLPAPVAGPRIGPAPQVLVRLRAESTGGTPVLGLESPAGRAELACRNDGHFPDDRRNDDQFGCAGNVLGDTVKLVYNGGKGQRKELGELQWEAGTWLRYASVDTDGGALSTELFPVVMQEESAPTSAPAAQPQPNGQPAPAPPGAPMESPPAEPYRWPALVMTGILCFAGGWWLRRPPSRLPSGLVALPSEPLFPGLEVARPAILRGEEPLVLLNRLLPQLSGRRVVLLGEMPRQVPPTVQVYGCPERDRLRVEESIQALARMPGLPLAVILRGDVLEDPGAVAGHPAQKLAETLPVGSWIFAILGREEKGWGWTEVEVPSS